MSPQEYGENNTGNQDMGYSIVVTLIVIIHNCTPIIERLYISLQNLLLLGLRCWSVLNL
jgi:hypothetical protein